MDWTIISIAGVSIAVITYLLGYRFGTTAGYTIGFQQGVLRAEDSFMKVINNLSKEVNPKDYLLTDQEIDYLNANIKQLDTIIEGMTNPEDAVTRKSLEEQRTLCKEVLEQDAKEKANV
jgi:hypothetical protein